jgi:two-component system, OmpR family, sensor histidine kinase BaeS
MLSTLRRRFILSHVLPLLVVLPLMGIALIYVLETGVLLDSLSRELRGQVLLVADLASQSPAIWTDPAQAQNFVSHLSEHLEARVMLLSSQGKLIASSNSADAGRIGTQFDIPSWASVLAGETIVRSIYSQSVRAEVVDALAPVFGPNQQVLGVVRLSHQLVTVFERFLRLRYLIAGVLLGGLLLGAVTGWVLALNLEHPLSQATDAVARLASGETMAPVAERGPAEIHQLLHTVNTLVERLRSAEEARRQLLANLVHELGRPLGALRSAIYALLGGAEEDVALRQELLVGMNQEIGHLRRLLDDLAGLHDQAFGALELHLEPTELGLWLTRLLPPWREAALAKGLRWQTNVEPDLPAVPIDSDRLAQALGNLLNNAIKYTPRKGTVTVSAGVNDQQLWIKVSDTGPGINQEDQERIFTPFYRSQPGRRFQQGMGLGLGIARDLVAAHGGWLELESTPGLGSDFTINLPLFVTEEGADLEEKAM